MDDDGSVRWRRYYRQTGGGPPRRTLLLALDRFAAEPPVSRARFAVDLGCGAGRDTIELLRHGWSVLAIDAEPAAIEELEGREDLPPGSCLKTRVARFEDTDWPECDLVNASFALPLCPPERFPALWRRIVASLRPGGRFCGQLYGERDGWAGDPGMTHLGRAAAEALFARLELEHFHEEEEDSITPRGKPKHWHIFHAVARKPAPPSDG